VTRALRGLGRILRLVGACVAFASLLLAGCKRGDAVAELEKADGKVSRDFAKSVGSWEAAATGAEFRIGDGVRSGTASHALLRLFDQSSLGLEPNTLIRFRARGSTSRWGRRRWKLPARRSSSS
jgi:hypothetical protein